jgi:MFS family permease
VPRFSITRTVDRDTAERLLLPRDDLVAEVALEAATTRPSASAVDADDARAASPESRIFGLGGGPFDRYERTVLVSEATPTGAPDRSGEASGSVSVVQTVDFRLPPGTWSFLMDRVFRSALRKGLATGSGSSRRLPWWFPPQRPDARAATVLGLLATLSLVVGYHGTLLTQTMTFAADEFGAGTAAQGNAFAAVRIGGLIAIVLGAAADRRGRRLILTLSLLSCVVSTVLGALVPSLALLAATQTVNRGAWAASSLLLAIIAVEEMPAGARAHALSLLAMTGALGAGFAVWLLPVADIGAKGSASWRLLYLFPLVFVPVIVRFGRLIPESRRYERPHHNVAFAGHYWRLLLLASTSFLFNVFMAPQSQFRNEFLRNERGMGAADVSLFILVTSTVAGLGIIVGGRLADTRGRRMVAASAVVVATIFITLSFSLDGPGMWLTAAAGGIFAAGLVPTIGVYGPELFPTSLRGRANGIITTVAMAGSVIGLAAAGHLEESLGSFMQALGVLAIAPLLMAIVIVAWFPETARRELEDINPEDRLDGDESAAVAREGGRPPPATASFDITPSG